MGVTTRRLYPWYPISVQIQNPTPCKVCLKIPSVYPEIRWASFRDCGLLPSIAYVHGPRAHQITIIISIVLQSSSELNTTNEFLGAHVSNKQFEKHTVQLVEAHVQSKTHRSTCPDAKRSSKRDLRDSCECLRTCTERLVVVAPQRRLEINIDVGIHFLSCDRTLLQPAPKRIQFQHHHSSVRLKLTQLSSDPADPESTPW